MFACSGRRRIKHYDPISQIAQLFAVCTQSMFQVIDQSPGGQECEVRVGKGVSQQSESKQDRSPTIRFESSSLKREVDDDMRVDVGSLQVFKGGVSGGGSAERLSHADICVHFAFWNQTDYA